MPRSAKIACVLPDSLAPAVPTASSYTARRGESVCILTEKWRNTNSESRANLIADRGRNTRKNLRRYRPPLRNIFVHARRAEQNFRVKKGIRGQSRQIRIHHSARYRKEYLSVIKITTRSKNAHTYISFLRRTIEKTSRKRFVFSAAFRRKR